MDAASELHDSFVAARNAPLDAEPGLSEERADAFVAEMRAGRSQLSPTAGVVAFDADALIYASVPGHALGRRVRALLEVPAPDGPGDAARIGSVLLLPGLPSKPIRDHEADELSASMVLLGRIDLRPVDRATAELAAVLGASCGPRTRPIWRRPSPAGRTAS